MVHLLNVGSQTLGHRLTEELIESSEASKLRHFLTGINYSLKLQSTYLLLGLHQVARIEMWYLLFLIEYMSGTNVTTLWDFYTEIRV